MRDKCPYTQAFINEVIRLRHISPLGLGRETTCNVSLGAGGRYKIPKKTTIIPIQANALMNSNAWKDAEQFNPEHFLVTDPEDPERRTFDGRPNSFHVPFSEGKRPCPGKTIALADIFLTVARILQQTRGHRFVPAGCQPESLDLTWDGSLSTNFLILPKPHKVKLA